MLHRTLPLFALGLLSITAPAETVQLAHDAALSPDGQTLAFAWRGDLWSVPATGGTATRLTQHSADESQPAYSPDGKQIAFASDRDGSKHLYLMPATGGEARQLTRHTEGHDLRQWMPDGQSLLVSINRDFSWMRFPRATRPALFNVSDLKAESVLFDDYAYEMSAAPDGKRFLFTREGEVWWRQGYQGSRAGQIWLFDSAKNEFKQVLAKATESRWPLWKPDASGFYFVSGHEGTFNLWQHDLASGKDTQITKFKGDSVVFPAISRNGKTIVFRHRFDLYRWTPGGTAEPVKIPITAATDAAPPAIERPILTSATAITHTRDGLQMAFIAGGDVWVMDTELKEPRRVTHTAEEERDLTFAPDGKSLWFISDAGGRTDIWHATPKISTNPWWENNAFQLTRITDDDPAESGLQFSDDGKKIAFLKNRGDLWVADGDGRNARRLFESWNAPSFHFSPDARQIVYAVSDEWFNNDIWLLPLDGAKPAFNLSRHPDNDYNPTWSPDGKKIAWTGRRENGEIDIFFVWLQAEDAEQSKRERTLAKAREKFKKPAATSARSKPSPPKDDSPPPPVAAPKSPTPEPATAPPAPTPAPKATPPKPLPPPLRIDFDGIHDRIQRIRIPDTSEGGLVWSADSKKLAFNATIEGKRGTYTLEPPDDTKPKLLATLTIAHPQWLKEGDQIVGLSEGKPVSLSAKGTYTLRAFRAQQSVERAAKQRAVFDQCWQIMRDRFYDERLGNRDWSAVREKYADMAAKAADMRTVQDVIHLMLGELNGSHLGFSLNPLTNSISPTWKEETAHLGLRFDPSHAGPGWKVRSVITKSPAAHKRSRILAGEIILRVEGQDVNPSTHASQVLNGPLDRDITLRVQAAEGKERDVTLRPITYATARQLLYDQWIKDNRRHVDEISVGKLGYLHISAMDDASFQKFQEELYAAGAGKDGLIIDVRENGGGSTTDHLLTALTQPRHAIAIPRGSSTPGYPQDRIIYATWDKPITVLCNQNSYSNAEVFSHAVKLLKRGQLVGVPTAGGVISTGSVSVMDVGSLRLPFRGWYGLENGLDMELNGATPDHLVWPQPGELASGIDRQLDKAIDVLQKDVKTWQARPQPKLQKASERFFKP